MSEIDGWKVLAPLAYMGKEDCEDVRCRRRWGPDGPIPGCLGYHCSYCDEPCGPQGHNCDASKTLRDAVDEIAKEAP